MNLKLQIYSFVFSFLFGIILSVFTNLNYGLLFNKNKKIKILGNFLFLFDIEEQIKSLEKLGIILENRKYTINEFDKLDEKIREYYKSEDKLKQKGILKQEYLSLLDVLNNIEPLTNDKILASLYGGVLTGIGTALILRARSSTGGSDLISVIIKAYNPMYRTGFIITIIDFVIVFLNIIFLRNIEIGLYSAITIFLMGKVIDILFEGIYFTKLLFIVSNKASEISEAIGKEIKRGVTGIYGKGMHTNEEKLVLMCAIGRNDLSEIKNVIKKIDPKAFIIITNSREVLGIGFKQQM